MPSAPPGLDAEVYNDLLCVQDARRIFRDVGKPVEFWEALCLVKGDPALVRDEVARLSALRSEGRAVGLGRPVQAKLDALRTNTTALVRGLRDFLAALPDGPKHKDLLEMTVAFIAVSPKGREAASRWIADPARHSAEVSVKVNVIMGSVEAYRRALASGTREMTAMPAAAPPPAAVALESAEFAVDAPAAVATAPRPAAAAPPKPAAPKPPVDLPPGVDPEILDDVRRVEQCRKIFEMTHQQIEVWEVYCLVMMERDVTKATMEELLRQKDAGEADKFMEGALSFFEKLLDVRAKFGRFVRKLREYVQSLAIGSFGKDTVDMALGFVVVSPRGREHAQRWLDDPARCKNEAMGRMEAIISKTLTYQTALRMIQQ